MFLKLLGIGAPVVLGAVYVSGALGGGYSRTVDRPQAEVMRALADLDITTAPGEPGTDPSRAGGIKPVIQLSQAADRMTWTVMSGQQIATQMTAIFEPIDAGHTRVTAVIERGDAPDDFTSPAFRSEGLTMGLFAMVLEDELNDLTLPKRLDAAACQRMKQEWIESGALAGDGGYDRPDDLGSAIGDTAKVAIKLHAMDAELRRQGCSTRFEAGFKEVEQRMTAAPSDMPRPSVQPRDGNVSFEPGKPMVDLKDYSR